MIQQKFHFLASPFSDPSPKVEHERYVLARNSMYYLWTKGIPAISTVALCYNLALDLKLPGHAAQWKAVNDWFLELCPNFTILTIKDWEWSKGLNCELYQASMLGKRIQYFNPYTHEFGDSPCTQEKDLTISKS